jgi:hypothetical protein
MAQSQIVVGISLALLLSGCLSDQSSTMKTALDFYLGRPITDHIVAKGPPTNTIVVSPNERLFQWVITRQGAGAVVPVSGILVAVPPRQESCMISLRATTQKTDPTLNDWIVNSYSWNGAC